MLMHSESANVCQRFVEQKKLKGLTPNVLQTSQLAIATIHALPSHKWTHINNECKSHYRSHVPQMICQRNTALFVMISTTQLLSFGHLASLSVDLGKVCICVQIGRVVEVLTILQCVYRVELAA